MRKEICECMETLRSYRAPVMSIVIRAWAWCELVGEANGTNEICFHDDRCYNTFRGVPVVIAADDTDESFESFIVSSNSPWFWDLQLGGRTMRKVIDAVANGRLWMELAAGLTIWHVDELDENGGIVRSTAVSDSKKAKAEWNKLKAKRPAWAAEKGVGV